MTMYEYDGKQVELLGIITATRIRPTKQKKMMANIVLELSLIHIYILNLLQLAPL